MSDTYEIASQEDLKNNPEYGDIKPLKSGNYIVKLAKIVLELKPTWNPSIKNWNYNEMKWVYNVIALPYAMENGDEMQDVEKTPVKPLTKWIFREINPFSIGFLPDNVTPSNLRAVIAYTTGQDVHGKIKPAGFILIDKEQKIVTDDAKRQAFIEDQKKTIDERTFVKEGYKPIPDIRSYEGKYIACAIGVDTKGRNKITRFSEVSSKFQPSKAEEDEKMPKFLESYNKMLEKKKNKGKGQN